jgi:predicted dehydrogenase
MTVRFGFIGFRHGHIFSLYNRILAHPETEVAGACEPHQPSRVPAENQGVILTCTQPEELINDPTIDVIAIGSAYGERGELVCKALEAGKHVISDKPFCITPAELDRIEQLLQKKNRVLGCMLDLRTTPNCNRAKEQIRSGAIGKLCSIQFNGMHPLNYGLRPAWYFEKGMHGGTINDIAIHLFDLLPDLTGNQVVRICSAHGGNIHFPQEPHFSNRGVLTLELENQIMVTGDVSYFAPSFSVPSYWRFTICGTTGMLEFNYGDPGVRLITQDSAEVLPPLPAGKDYLDAFLDELAGNPSSPCTAEILRAARWALEAQALANQN